ncbi:WRC domain [Dillenia turbinata]|uniref:WRC domain n=1 Tax=Dillenia turbinata TaxID=194707 RepID=A0AAN8UER8_9MAGN
MKEENEETVPEDFRCCRKGGGSWRCKRRVLENKKFCQVHYLQNEEKKARERRRHLRRHKSRNRRITDEDERRPRDIRDQRENLDEKKDLTARVQSTDEEEKVCALQPPIIEGSMLQNADKRIQSVPDMMKGTEAIRNLKKMFCQKEGISEHLQQLFSDSGQLKVAQTLISYGVHGGSTPYLFIPDSISGAVPVLVNIPTKMKTILVALRPHETICSIKSDIAAKEGIEPDQYSLMYAGKILDNDMILDSAVDLLQKATLLMVTNPGDKISVLVKTLEKGTAEVEVMLLHTVNDVKALVGCLSGLAVRDYDLIYSGVVLDGIKTLASYSLDIKEGSVFEMLPVQNQILVKTVEGKTLIICVQPSDTIKDVKKKVSEKLNSADYSGIRLLFSGKELQDDQVLASYDIQSSYTLHVVYKAGNASVTH